MKDEEKGPVGGMKSLARKTSRGVAVTVTGLWTKTLIQLVSTMVLARLLDPSDFGLIAMVMAIIGVVDLIRDFGLTAAIMQAKKIGASQWSSLLWFSLALGTVLTILVALSAPVVAWIYGEDRLLVLTLVMSPAMVCNGLAMPMQAAVQRDLRFGVLAKIDVVSMIVSAICGIAAGLMGFGVWSLVILAGSGFIYRLTSLWIAAKPRFGRPRIAREIVPIVTTGGSVLGTQLIGYAVRNLDNIFIGQQLGAAPLGQYSRAYALFLLPMQQINGPLSRVALPVLSRLQDDASRYRRYIRGAFLVIGYITFPAYAIAAATAGPLIDLLLGAGWERAATVFTLLSIAGVVQVIVNVQSWIYITLGHAHRQVLYSLVQAAVVIPAYLVGIAWNGIEGLALLYGLTTALLLVPGFWYAIRGTFVQGSDIAVPLARPAMIAPLCFVAAWWASRYVERLPSIVELVVGGLAGLAVLVVAHVFKSVRRDTFTILEFAKKARR